MFLPHSIQTWTFHPFFLYFPLAAIYIYKKQTLLKTWPIVFLFLIAKVKFPFVVYSPQHLFIYYFSLQLFCNFATTEFQNFKKIPSFFLFDCPCSDEIRIYVWRSNSVPNMALNFHVNFFHLCSFCIVLWCLVHFREHITAYGHVLIQYFIKIKIISCFSFVANKIIVENGCHTVPHSVLCLFINVEKM